MNPVFLNDLIVSNPEICHGKPVFVGTRIMVWQVLEMLAMDSTAKNILETFPSLNASHIKSALDYASFLTREKYASTENQTQVFA